MRIQMRHEGGCQVMMIHGSADTEASPSLREALMGAIEAGQTHIVCDLGRADFLCSDALGALITAYLKARGRGGFVRLADPTEPLRELLKTTRLDHLFDIYSDVTAATARP